MASMAGNLFNSIYDYLDIGFPQVWRAWYEGVELPDIPDGCLFTSTTLEEVLTTQFFMRWFFKEFFYFTFKQETFKKEVQFLWQSWIKNRHSLHEKVIDALAVVMEAKLFCSRYKNFDLTFDDGKEIVRKCLDSFNLDEILNEELDKFYETSSDYQRLTDYRKEYMEMFKNFEDPNYNDMILMNLMRNSEVHFPVQNSLILGGDRYSTVFVRLHNEMNFFRSFSMVTNASTYRCMYYPQDRKIPTPSVLLRFTEPAEIIDEEVATIADKDISWHINNFSSNVLKLEKDDDRSIYLISERYNNSWKEMLSRRYTVTPGTYFGESHMGNQSSHTYNEFYVDRTSPPEDGLHWIEGIHTEIIYFMIKKPSSKDSTPTDTAHSITH